MTGRSGVTHYDTLGVEPEAGAEQIRRAYLREAQTHHPDRGIAEGGDRMRDLNAAWAVLSDPTSRAAYDRSLGRNPTESRDFVRRPDSAFVPLDDSDDDDLPAEALSDEGDPRTSPGRGLLLAPVVLAGLALVVGFGWIVVDDDRLLAVAVALGLVAAVTFLAVPLVAMTRAAKFERR